MRKILEAIIVGVLFGLLAHVADNFLPENFHFLFETGLIFILPAFLLAFNMPLRRRETDCIIIAVVELLATGLSYYLSKPFLTNQDIYITEELIHYIPISIAIGIITGIVAYLGHSATNQIVRYGSVSLLPAIYTGNGVNDIINTMENFQFTPEIGVKVIGGLLFYFLISGSNRFKLKSLGSFAALIAITALFYLNMV